jgi:F-type H+-transporting ATPase subunit b
LFFYFFIYFYGDFIIDRIIAFDSQLLIQVICQIISTIVCVSIIAKFLYLPVRKFLDNRKKSIEDNIEKARENLNQAEIFVELYEKKVSDINNKEQEILKSAHEKALLIEKDIIDKANLKARKILEDARQNTELELKKISNDTKKEILNISWIVTNEFIKNHGDKEFFFEQAKNILEEIKDKNILNDA